VKWVNFSWTIFVCKWLSYYGTEGVCPSSNRWLWWSQSIHNGGCFTYL